MSADEARAREVLASTLPDGSMVQRLVLSGQSPDQEMFTIDDTIAAMLAFNAPPDGEREEVESGWLVEENAGSGIIHWIALEAESWPRTKVRRLRRAIRVPDDDDIELEDYQTPVRRVKDANEALRFARKEDADAFIALFDRFLLCPVATEHQWVPPATLSPHQGDREAIARVVKGARLSAAFGREFRAGDGRLDDVDLDAADSILRLAAPSTTDLVKACEGIADDYMTSEKHHPGYVLIPTEKFEQIVSALSLLQAPPPTDEGVAR